MPPEGGADDDGDDEDESYVCGYDDTKHTDGPCQFPVIGPDQRCHNHPKDGSGPPDGVGSGDPGHSMGAGPGDIQERNGDNPKPNFKTGIHAVRDDPFGTLDWLEENRSEAYEWIVNRWRNYLADAPFDESDSGKAGDLLMACLFDFAVRTQTNIQVREGLTHMETRASEHGTFEVETEHPGNLPADRLVRQSRSLKKDLGVLDDPESAKADAISEGWGAAARRVAQRVDSEVADPDDEPPEVIDHA